MARRTWLPEGSRKVLGRFSEGSRKVLGRFSEGSRKVLGRFSEGESVESGPQDLAALDMAARGVVMLG